MAKEMENLVRRRFDPNDPIGSKVYQKEYHMVSPTGEIILPETWDRLIKPGWVVEMRLSSSSEDEQKRIGLQAFGNPSVYGSSVAASTPSNSIKPPASQGGISSASNSSSRRKESSIKTWFRGRKPRYIDDSD